MPEIQLHARLEAPFQGHLVNRDGWFGFATDFVHGRVVVVGRVQMRAVVCAQLDEFHGPAFTIGQVFFFQAWKKRLDLRNGILVIKVFNFRRISGRVTHHIVFQINGQINKSTRHGVTSLFPTIGFLTAWEFGRPLLSKSIDSLLVISGFA
jgi:hypothetical protein